MVQIFMRKKNLSVQLAAFGLAAFQMSWCLDLLSAEVALQLQGGVSAVGEIQYIDGRGIGLLKAGGGIIDIPPSQLAPSSLTQYQSWIRAEALPAGAKLDHDYTVSTQVGTLAYDTTKLEAAAGSFVRVTLNNADDLQHNIVFSHSADADSGQSLAGFALALGAEGMTKQWIPESGPVLAASAMADPHTRVAVLFKSPKADGSYPYVCTFPGHAAVMKGQLHIGEVQSLSSEVALNSIQYRAYKGAWNRLPDFSKLQPDKSGTQSGGLMDMPALGYREEFGVVFEADLKLSLAGDYVFGLSSDDGSRLWIDNTVIVDLDGTHGMDAPTKKKVALTSGNHKIKVEFFERNGGEGLYVEVTPPTGPVVLLTPGQSPASDNSVGIPLYPLAGEAMIYRNFIDGVGTARGIGVGFSEGIHFAYDAQNARLTQIWKGGFIDAKKHWTDRGVGYQAPSEATASVDPSGAMMAVLDSPDARWPSHDFVALGKSADYSAADQKPSRFKFLGYALNAKRHPVFSWEWNGLTVTDYTRPTPQGNLRRTLTFNGTPDTDGSVYLRLGKSNDSIDVSLPPRIPFHTADDGIRVPLDLTSGTTRININYHLK